MEDNIRLLTLGLEGMIKDLEKTTINFKENLEKNPNLATEFATAFNKIDLSGNVESLRAELNKLSKLK